MKIFDSVRIAIVGDIVDFAYDQPEHAQEDEGVYILIKDPTPEKCLRVIERVSFSMQELSGAALRKIEGR